MNINDEYKYVVLYGDSDAKSRFHKTHPNIQCKTSKIREGGVIHIVVGKGWKEEAVKLENQGLIFWQDIYPDWMDILIHQNSYFIFDEVKKYAGSIEGIADIFQYISKYKEIAAVYGNCQSLYISQLLCKSNEFKMQYIMCRFTFIQNIVDEKKTGFDEKYMKYIDLFIYQIAKRDNAFGENLSTECILPLLKENAIKISIPFIYFNAYFPQYIKNTRNDDVRRGEGHAPYGDSKIQYYAENGLGIDAIVENLKGDNLFSYEEIQRNLQNTIEALSVREKECDIQILDYILENYKDEYLFYSPSHPTNICQAELAKRILRYLGMDDTLRDYQDLAENDRTEMFIYPSVRKHLELTFEKKSFVLYREDKNELYKVSIANEIYVHKD